MKLSNYISIVLLASSLNVYAETYIIGTSDPSLLPTKNGIESVFEKIKSGDRFILYDLNTFKVVSLIDILKKRSLITNEFLYQISNRK